MKKCLLTVSAALLTLSGAEAAQAASTIASAYTRTSGPESFVAPFTLPFGTLSSRIYTGSVEVNVSGSGYSNGPFYNNAFEPFGTGYYSLGMGTSAQPFGPFNPALSIARFIDFIEGVGAVPMGTAPTYNGTGNYKFVVDIGALSSKLSFGVLDGMYSDNGGQFNVTLYQLRAGVGQGGVPEPTTWAMMIIGFGVVGGLSRQRRAKLGTSINPSTFPA